MNSHNSRTEGAEVVALGLQVGHVAFGLDVDAGLVLEEDVLCGAGGVAEVEAGEAGVLPPLLRPGEMP